jgi:hypothetical protein
MATPDFRSEASSDQQGSTATQLFMPTTWAANDILVIFVATDGYVPTLSSAQGFVLAQDPQGHTASVTTNGGTPGTADCGLFIFWKRALGNSTAQDPAPTIAATTNGGTCWALEMNSYQGARTTGTPWHIITTAIVSSATATIAPPAVTPTLNNCLVMAGAASSNDDQAFNDWTFSGAASPIGQIDAGWHSNTGNGCAFNSGRGGYATAAGARSGTTTFGATTKQAQISLVMASLAEVAPPLSWAPTYPERTRRSSLTAAAMTAALVVPLLPPAVPAPAMSWAPSFPDASSRARGAQIAGGQAEPEATLPNPAVPTTSWLPSFPDRALIARGTPIVGGTFAPDATLPDEAASVATWLPTFPGTTTRLRGAPIIGGFTGPEATLPNAPAPALSWRPLFPDSIGRLRGAPIVGGSVAPEADLPNTAAPGMSWAATFADQISLRRQPQHNSLTAPPFAGGQRLTIGDAAVRQNILSALTFTGGSLTTFGTDITVTANSTTDTFTATAHAMVMGAGPFMLATTGTFPGGTDGVTPYYMSVTGVNTFKLALSATLAIAGTVVDVTSNGTGTITLLRTRNTAPLYSTFVTIFARGTQASSPNQSTDSFGNAYTYAASTPRAYDNFTASAVSVGVKLSGVGGPAHTWSASIGNVGGNEDEVTIGGLEIYHAPILKNASIVERADGANVTNVSSTVQTTARALLVAIVFGNSNVGQDNTWTFLDGFSKVRKVSSEGDVNPAGYIQTDVAVKFVDIPGTYSFRATGTNSSGAQMVLLAFQAFQSDLAPLDWLMPLPEVPVRRRPGQLGGATEPPFVIPAAVPSVAGWAPVLEVSRSRRAVISGDHADPISTNQPIPWLPKFVDTVARRRAGEVANGLTTPPSDTNAGPLTWSPAFPDRLSIRPRAILGGESAPASDRNAGPLTWAPTFPDRLSIQSRTTSVGENAPPAANTQSIPLTWTSGFSDRLSPRAKVTLGGEVAPPLPPPPDAQSVPLAWAPRLPDQLYPHPRVISSGEVSPPVQSVPSTWFPCFADRAPGNTLLFLLGTDLQSVLFVPAPAPARSWAPTYPDRVQRARSAPIEGGNAEPEATFPNAPAPDMSWAPEFQDTTTRARGAQIAGGQASPDATLPNPAAPLLSWMPRFVDIITSRLHVVDGMLTPELTLSELHHHTFTGDIAVALGRTRTTRLVLTGTRRVNLIVRK